MIDEKSILFRTVGRFRSARSNNKTFANVKRLHSGPILFSDGKNRVIIPSNAKGENRMKQQQPKALSPMEYAMKYLTARDRTVSEMQAYLDAKEFGEADVDATVARLMELGLLDDGRYAKRFVETRLASKPISRRHLSNSSRGTAFPTRISGRRLIRSTRRTNPKTRLLSPKNMRGSSVRSNRKNGANACFRGSSHAGFPMTFREKRMKKH